MKSLKGAQTALWLRDLGSRVSIVNFAKEAFAIIIVPVN